MQLELFLTLWLGIGPGLMAEVLKFSQRIRTELFSHDIQTFFCSTLCKGFATSLVPALNKGNPLHIVSCLTHTHSLHITITLHAATTHYYYNYNYIYSHIMITLHAATTYCYYNYNYIYSHIIITLHPATTHYYYNYNYIYSQIKITSACITLVSQSG